MQTGSMNHANLTLERKNKNAVLRVQQEDGKYVEFIFNPCQAKAISDKFLRIYNELMLMDMGIQADEVVDQLGPIEPAFSVGDNVPHEPVKQINQHSTPSDPS